MRTYVHIGTRVRLYTVHVMYMFTVDGEGGIDLKVCLGVPLPVYREFDLTIFLGAHVIREGGLV